MSVLAAVEAAGCCEAMRYLSDTFLCSLRKGFLDTLAILFLETYAGWKHGAVTVG